MNRTLKNTTPDLRSRLLVSLLVGAIVIIGGTNMCFAQTAGAEALRITVTLKGRYNPDFKVCMQISEAMPIDVSWGKDPLRQSLSVVLKGKNDKGYQVETTNKVFAEGRQISSMMQGLTLMLEKPVRTMNMVSSLFNDVRERTVLLSRSSCSANEP
jgi:DNA-binding XRE family transcriptional regulator